MKSPYSWDCWWEGLPSYERNFQLLKERGSHSGRDIRELVLPEAGAFLNVKKGIPGEGVKSRQDVGSAPRHKA